MRTKTLALSAVLGALGTASLVAQTSVYSLNAVGYINVTMPPGFSIITCPLIVGTDTEFGFPNVTNDLNVVLNNDGGAYAGASVYAFVGGVGFGASDSGAPAAFGGGWAGSGSDIGQNVTLMPGQAVFFSNPNAIGGANMTATFVGTVPQGSLTNTLAPGFNLVGSIVPTSGDLQTGSIAGGFGPSGANNTDTIFFFNPASNGHGGQLGYSGVGDTVEFSFGSWSGGNGANGDPVTTSVSQGFFYENAGSGPLQWVENFSVNP